MGLISLTFGNDYKYQKPYSSHISIKRPQDSFISGQKCGYLKIKKVEKFLGTEEVCVIGKLVSGIILPEMETELETGIKAEVKEVESKYGSQIVAKPGTSLLLMIKGAQFSHFNVEEVLEFHLKEEQARKKKKGKLIIC